MFAFRPVTFREHLFRLWPPYRRRTDAELRKVIRYLVDHPEEPCIVGDTFIPDGYETKKGASAGE